jgi:hypothetical protein
MASIAARTFFEMALGRSGIAGGRRGLVERGKRAFGWDGWRDAFHGRHPSADADVEQRA